MSTKTSPRKWIARTLIGLAIILALVIGFSLIIDTTATNAAIRDYPAPGDFVDLEGTRMHYICHGDPSQTPTLVLVHGYAGGAIDWLPFIDALPDNQHVRAFDRIGSDYSDIDPRRDHSMTQVVSDLNSALTQLGIDAPILVGHSLGGGIVQLYAAQHPVSGVILMDGLSADIADDVVTRMGTYASLTLPARLGLLRPMAPSFVSPAYTGDLYDRMVALRSRSSAIIAIAHEGTAASQELRTEDLLAAEADIQAPLLIIAADATDVPEGEPFTHSLESFAERHPDAAYHTIADAPHYVMTTHPAKTVTIITTWLDQLAPESK